MFRPGITLFPILAIFSLAPGRDKPAPSTATLVVEIPGGRTLFRQGPVEVREAPCSTFKIPLAAMGFDAGILTATNQPVWTMKADDPVNTPLDRLPTAPDAWLRNSVVWYSQELTRRLGTARFASYVNAFDYGNRDLSRGPKGEPGLTHAWLMGSLAISPAEQVRFLQKLLEGSLPITAAAKARVLEAVPTYGAAGGWTVHGKTGSGRPLDETLTPMQDRPQGWFIGWAGNGSRQVAFARFERVAMETNGFWGGEVRSHILSNLDRMTTTPR